MDGYRSIKRGFQLGSRYPQQVARVRVGVGIYLAGYLAALPDGHSVRLRPRRPVGTAAGRGSGVALLPGVPLVPTHQEGFGSTRAVPVGRAVATGRIDGEMTTARMSTTASAANRRP